MTKLSTLVTLSKYIDNLEATRGNFPELSKYYANLLNLNLHIEMFITSDGSSPLFPGFKLDEKSSNNKYKFLSKGSINLEWLSSANLFVGNYRYVSDLCDIVEYDPNVNTSSIFLENDRPNKNHVLMSFIYHRLIETHGENKNYDYMIAFEKLIKSFENE